ncbi:MAG: hypothetical protein L6300_09835 [Syntrophaceae bacterium]|nr:hypothetical protein [Syntrophaceae bacterium]
MGRDNPDELPRWLKRPRPVEIFQRSLFPITLKDALVRLGISEDDLSRWNSKGLVSFDGSLDFNLNEYDDPLIFELTFVRDVVRSGLSDSQIKNILEHLPKPFAFNPDRIAYSFKYGWVETVPAVSTEDIIEEHLDSCLEEMDTEELQELQERISELLDLAKNDSNGGI